MIKKAEINYKSYIQKHQHTCFNSRNKQPPSPNNTLAGLPFSRGPKRRKAKAVRSSTCIHPKRKTKAKRANPARGIWNNPPGWCTEAPRARGFSPTKQPLILCNKVTIAPLQMVKNVEIGLKRVAIGAFGTSPIPKCTIFRDLHAHYRQMLPGPQK